MGLLRALRCAAAVLPLVLAAVPAVWAQDACAPDETGPQGKISAEERFLDVLRTAVSPVNFGVQPERAVMHARDGDPMSVVQLDLLRHLRVEQHPCLRTPFDTFCGLGPRHPANSGQMLYTFSDPLLNLEGHATQTLIGGICLDRACTNMTTVAVHPGKEGCTYFLAQEAKANAPRHLSSLVSALTSVGEVSEATIAAEWGPDAIQNYGVVNRHDKRDWKAVGYRKKVRPVSGGTFQCDMSQWLTSSHAAPRGCSGTAAPDAHPVDGWFYSHVRDTNTTGPVHARCERLGRVLLAAASVSASSQDTAASGLNDGAFLSSKPDRKSRTEIALAVVSAIQGVSVAFALLFLRADERAVGILNWWCSSWRRAHRLPQLPPVLVSEVPMKGIATLRQLLLILTLFVAGVEFAPLGFALHGELEAKRWVGAFSHVDLAVVMPGPSPTSQNGDGIPCSEGVAFVIIPLLGRARYLKTRYLMLVISLVVLAVCLIFMFGLRVWTWRYPVVVTKPPPPPLAVAAYAPDDIVGAPTPATLPVDAGVGESEVEGATDSSARS